MDMSTTPRRRRLVPASAVIAIIVTVVLVAGAIAASVFWAQTRVVAVPDITGLPLDIAERALEVSALEANVTGTRVSIDIPQGAVLSQSPEPGTEVKRGASVDLVLSAGPQSFPLPDVIGLDVDEARGELVGRGLVVNVVGVSAEASAGVVVEMYPSPGTSVNTGDVVRLSVPGGSQDSDMLLPYDLDGLSIVLDPPPPDVDDPGDPALDVARRLSALLQAAGGRVVTTRTATETAPGPETRLEAARGSGASLLLGIDVARTGEPGLRVGFSESAGDAESTFTTSRELAASITRAARLPGVLVLEPRESSDEVLAGFDGLGVRVVIGDIDAEADRVRMTDPEWADSVARAIYRGIGTLFAER